MHFMVALSPHLEAHSHAHRNPTQLMFTWDLTEAIRPPLGERRHALTPRRMYHTPSGRDRAGAAAARRERQRHDREGSGPNGDGWVVDRDGAWVVGRPGPGLPLLAGARIHAGRSVLPKGNFFVVTG